MKRAITLTIAVLLAVIVVSCSGPDKNLNKEYNIKDGHAKTKECIEMVKKDLSKSEPAAKIVKYTDVSDLVTENSTSHYMIVQVNNNGDVKNRSYYFPDDYKFVTQQLDRLVRYNLGQEDEYGLPKEQ